MTVFYFPKISHRSFTIIKPPSFSEFTVYRDEYLLFLFQALCHDSIVQDVEYSSETKKLLVRVKDSVKRLLDCLYLRTCVLFV